ncbi:MAG: hypothetical protein AAF497_25960, partial [Planctomycetota bacterium]
WQEAKQEWSILSSFALPAVLTGFILTAVAWFGRTTLLNVNNGDVQMGLFGAADQWRMIVLFLPSALSSVALPILSQSHSSGEEGAFHNAISVNVEIVYRITLPISFAIAALAIPLTLLYGKGFETASIVIPVIMLSVFIHSVNQAVRQAYGGAGRIWTNLCMHVAWAIVYVVACWKLLNLYGAYGFAWVHVIADFALFFMQVAYVETCLAPGALQSHWRPILFGVLLFATTIFVGYAFGTSAGTVAAIAGMVIAGMPTFRLAWKSRETILQKLKRLTS